MPLTEEQKNEYEEYLQGLRIRLADFLLMHKLPIDKNFVCVNPNHVHTKYTGSMSYDAAHNKVHCFGNCEPNPNFDIFDMAGFLGSVTDFKDKVKYAAGILGVDSFKVRQNSKKNISFFNGKHSFLIRDGLIPEENEKGESLLDRTGLIHAGLKNIKKAADYLESRGIQRCLAAEYSVGYMPKFNFLGTDGIGLVIPIDKYRLTVRDISGNYKDRYLKLGSGTVGGVFNSDAILHSCESGKPVFVTEGELDALSVISAGGKAVALRGKEITGFDFALDAAVKKTGKKPIVVLACDNDDAGMKANRALENLLKSKGIDSYCLNILYCGFKDPNEALSNTPNRFKRLVEDFQSKTNLEKFKYYQENNALKTAREIFNSETNVDFIPTGFSKIDNVLNGGLFNGFYFLGALPGFGKSTLAIQMAENIAKSKRDVLYFGMEMPKEAIVSRSLSRMTYIVSMSNNLGETYAKSSRDILLHRFETATERKVFADAYKIYESIGYHMLPISGIYSGNDIFQKVKNHVKSTGQRPVVFVDYLQIMANSNNNCSDKQNIDANIKGLVPIITEFKVPVVVISSFNRLRTATTSMANFNGSSGIESYADCLMVFDFENAGREGFNLKTEKANSPRKMVVNFLKNRYGDDSASVTLDYYAKYNYLTDSAIKTINNDNVDKDISDYNREEMEIYIYK